MLELATDVKAGQWEKLPAGLSLSDQPGGWCEFPVVPTNDYELTVKFTPRTAEKGEFLFQLPLGPARTLLHVNAKGAAHFDLTDQGGESGTFVPFEAGKVCELKISCEWQGQNGRIAVVSAGRRPLTWSGNLKRLSAPADLPVAADHLAVGARDLDFTLSEARISAPDSGVRYLRDLPWLLHKGKTLLGAWNMNDVPPDPTKMLGGPHQAFVLGHPVFATPGGIVGGAMKLTGEEPAGFRLEENGFSNKGQHQIRTVALWFNPDALDPLRRQYLYDEGSGEKGGAIYLLGDTLVAGEWGENGKWISWLHAPGVIAHRWSHVALVLDARPVDKSKGLTLYLDGRQVAQGEGHGLSDTREPIVFGTSYKSTHHDSAEANPAVVNRAFAGLVDEVILYTTR